MIYFRQKLEKDTYSISATRAISFPKIWMGDGKTKLKFLLRSLGALAHTGEKLSTRPRFRLPPSYNRTFWAGKITPNTSLEDLRMGQALTLLRKTNSAPPHMWPGIGGLFDLSLLWIFKGADTTQPSEHFLAGSCALPWFERKLHGGGHGSRIAWELLRGWGDIRRYYDDRLCSGEFSSVTTQPETLRVWGTAAWIALSLTLATGTVRRARSPHLAEVLPLTRAAPTASV